MEFQGVYLFCTFIFTFAIGVFGFFSFFFSLYLFTPIHGNRASVFFDLTVTGFAFSSEIFLIAQRPESSTVVEF